MARRGVYLPLFLRPAPPIAPFCALALSSLSAASCGHTNACTHDQTHKDHKQHKPDADSERCTRTHGTGAQPYEWPPCDYIHALYLCSFWHRNAADYPVCPACACVKDSSTQALCRSLSHSCPAAS